MEILTSHFFKPSITDNGMFVHSLQEIISTVCDFPYKIIVLSAKCHKHHLNGKIMQQNKLWTSVMCKGFTTMYGLKIKRNRQKIAVAKTVLITFLSNLCENTQLTACLASWL